MSIFHIGSQSNTGRVRKSFICLNAEVLPVQMEEQEQSKYNYRFSLSAGRIGPMTAPEKEELEKSDLQAYINEVLGLQTRKQDKNRLPY